MKITKSNLEDLIERYKKTYLENPSIMISGFNQENQTVADYNGRQILELIQNADDASNEGSKIIHIEIDTVKQELCISNNGDAFDLEGVESLMFPGNSPKNKTEYIGNKGLGFRSILNWVDSVTILTQDVSITFSATYTKEFFNKYLHIDDVVKKRAAKEAEKKKLPGVIPLATLAFPSVSENNADSKFETQIVLKYKKDQESSILEQLNELSEETLLFLPNSERIAFIENGKQRFDFKKEIKAGNKVSIGNKSWNVFSKKDISYSENVNFSYAIAWQDDLSDRDTNFYTYFPTDIKIHLPCLIHATFDLTSNRKGINSVDENKTILQTIPVDLAEIASKRFENETSSWKPYKLLKPTAKSDNKTLVEFYQNIDKLREELPIYPCVDGTYCKKEEVVFYGNEFSKWVIRNDVSEHFSNLLLPSDMSDLLLERNNPYTYEKWYEIINKVTYSIKSTTERALLIKLLTSDSFNELHESDLKLPLLVDDSGIVISETEQAFILLESDTKGYSLPDFVSTSFISNELYLELKLVLAKEINEIKEKRKDPEHVSRSLKTIISDVVNIGSNDIIDVIKNIVGTTSEKINATDDSLVQNSFVKRLVSSLFSIYTTNPERKGSLSFKIPLLNGNSIICDASELYLGKEYEYGKTTSVIFKDIFTVNDYLANNEVWGLEDYGNEYLENFFDWLGVNRISKIVSFSKKLYRDDEDEYTKYVFHNTVWPINNSHKDYTVKELSDFSEISSNSSFCIEVLLAWIIKDIRIYNQLNFDNSDEFNYKYNTVVTTVNLKPSYIYYQIKELYLKKLNSKFILDLDFASNLGYNSINFKHQVFEELGIRKTEIINVLQQLNIKLEFSDLTPEEVFEIIRILPERDPEGKYARKIYELAFEYFRDKKELPFSSYSRDYSLYAKRKEQKEYIPVSEVYYSDNATLPTKIAEEFWLLDFPTRQGEDQISKYFGVKTFKDIQISIINESIKVSNAFKEFQEWFHKIKPFILTYRLSSLNTRKDIVAETLKKTELIIVSSLTYEMKEGENKILLPGEFLPHSNGRDYYLCVENGADLNLIKDTPQICEAFAEILCVLFKVNDHKDDYRMIFKDKNSLVDTKYLINIKMLINHYEEAVELLGVSIIELEFWKNIYSLMGLELPSDIQDANQLYKMIKDDLSLDFTSNHKNLDYERFENKESITLLKSVIDSLGLKMNDLFKPESIGVIKFHKQTFENTLLDYKKYFDSCLWEYLSINSEKQDSLITSQRSYDDLISSENIEKKLNEFKFELDVDYIALLKTEVKNVFNILIEEKEKKKITFVKSYNELLAEFKISEVDIESQEVRSLLYFEGNEEKLKDLLKEEAESKNGEDSGDDTASVTPGEIIYSSTKKIMPSTVGSRTNPKTWNHSNKGEGRKKRAGRKAELFVYNSLKNNADIDDVRWVSGFSNTSDKSDDKHYDIRYKPANSEKWKYLEVKAFNGAYFHLSRSEKEEGLKRKEDYEVALVFNNEVHILTDLFGEEVDFENNEVFTATPSDYMISLNIVKNK